MSENKGFDPKTGLPVDINERLKKQLEFSLEIDKEKNIFRQTHLSGHGRNENDAEHAWHMAIMAFLLKEYANEEVDISKVMLMCLIHDVVEIDAGDTYAYDEVNLKTKKEKIRQKKEFSQCFLMTRKISLYHCLMNLKKVKRQRQSLQKLWTICNRYF